MATLGKTKTKKGNKAPKPTRQALIEEALDYHKQGYSAVEIAGVMRLKPDAVMSLIGEGLEAAAGALRDARTDTLTEIVRLLDAQKSIATNVANGEPEAIRLMRSLEKDLAEAKVRLDPKMRDIFSNAALFELGRIWTPTGRRKQGRPNHQPTVASTAQVEALVMVNTTKEDIAKIVGIDVKTLDKYYSPVMDIAKARVKGKLGGLVVEGAENDPRLALELLSRQGVEGFVAPQNNTPSGKGNKGDEYNPGSNGGGAAAAAGVKEVVHRVVVEGGLPSGSTPEKPEGDNYSDVPPEEERK
jgi:hypothetical protein